MAKKKGKKNLLTNVGVLTAMAAALLAVVAICMMFVPAAVVTDTKITYTGLQLTFGYSEDTILGTVSILDFSFLNFLPYILALAGIVFNVLTALGKLGKIAPIVATVCYLAAGILFFLATTMCAPHTGDSKDLADAFRETLSLGAGAIVAGVLSILAALSSAVAVIKK